MKEKCTIKNYDSNISRLQQLILYTMRMIELRDYRTGTRRELITKHVAISFKVVNNIIIVIIIILYRFAKATKQK